MLKSTFKLLDVKGKATNDVLCVLFNDLLLLAEMKPHMNKKVSTRYSEQLAESATHGRMLISSLSQFTVIDQPIPIHQLSVYDDTSSSRPVFTIVTLTALCQHVAMFSFLCPSLYDKHQWVAKMHGLGAAVIGQ